MVPRQARQLECWPMCRALEEHAGSVVPVPQPAAAAVELAAAGVPAAPIADFVESAAESDARVAAPVAQSDEHSGPTEESVERLVAKSDCSMDQAVLSDCHTTPEAL